MLQFIINLDKSLVINYINTSPQVGTHLVVGSRVVKSTCSCKEQYSEMQPEQESWLQGQTITLVSKAIL